MKTRQNPPRAGKAAFNDPKNLARMINNIKFNMAKCERALEPAGLEATQQRNLERRLRGLQIELQERERALRQAKVEQNYKYVRFVELKKALRRLKQAKKALGDETAEELAEAVSRCEADLAYVQHFPRDQPYISLWPAASDAPGSTTDADRMRIHGDISQRLLAGDLQLKVPGAPSPKTPVPEV